MLLVLPLWAGNLVARATPLTGEILSEAPIPTMPEPPEAPSASDRANTTAVPLPFTLEDLRHHGGEAAVGLSIGAITGWIARRFQSAVTTLTIVGGIGAAAALHLGWATPMQVATE